MNSRLLNSLVLALSWCVGFKVNGADTNAPVIVSAASFDGQTIGVCFSEELYPASPTNVANYRISYTYTSFRLADTNFAVVEAVFSPDQRSVILKLSKRFPGVSFNLYANNVKDPAGNSRPTGSITAARSLSAPDIGQPGFDPLETGTFSNCELGAYEVVAGGSGLEGTNDSFHFIYEPSRGPSLILLGRVTSLEAANRYSSAGLMVRESLVAGSRFFSITVTPLNVPARDGNGNGANTVQLRYRDVTSGPSVELIPTNTISSLPYPDVWLQLFRGDRRCEARFSTNYLDWVVLGSFTFTDPFPDQVLAGMATFSHNNAPGFTTKATYSNAGLLRGDVFTGPELLAQRLGSNLLLQWTEPFEFPYFMLSSPVLASNIFWIPVTNQVSYQFTPSNVQASVTIPTGESAVRYFGLRMSRW